MKTKLIIILITTICVSFVALAQRTRPVTDVELTESTFVHASIQDGSILLYAVYNDTTHVIQGYVLWNDTESVATASLEFVTGDPVALTAQPGTRDAARVGTRGYVMIFDSESGEFVDLNVLGHTLGNDGSVDFSARDRTFPLPRER